MNALRIIQADPLSLNIDRREVYRYLGYKNPPKEGPIVGLTEEMIEKTVRELDCRCVYTRFPLEIDGNSVSFPGFSTKSEDLAKNLAGCGEIYLFAATIGVGFDRFLTRTQAISPASALVADCVGSACIEAFANEVNARLDQQAAAEGRSLRPRFSPGYGDFPLSDQQILLGLLQASKKAGISLTDSGMMVPAKSVSALIGIGKTRPDCGSSRCVGCTKENCAYRA